MQKRKHDHEPADSDRAKPRNAPRNAMPVQGHLLLVDGKFKTQFETAEAATAAGLSLKEKYPVVRVQIYDAAARSYAPVELAEGVVKLRVNEEL
jgi:hypothetical protein